MVLDMHLNLLYLMSYEINHEKDPFMTNLV